MNRCVRLGWLLLDGGVDGDRTRGLVNSLPKSRALQFDGDHTGPRLTGLDLCLVLPEDHQVKRVRSPGSRRFVMPIDLYGTFSVLEFEVVRI